MADTREKALQDYRKKLLEHKEVDGRLKELREQLRDQTKQYEKSENDLKALQSVGQIVGEVLKQLTEEKCKFTDRYYISSVTAQIHIF
uniref:Proteasome 26S subunit, ATPase 6 n=1 Tax=Mola mola TaxID=94237 RepID=A0A3Q3X3V4_MOLML